jgi:hypothetical protein
VLPRPSRCNLRLRRKADELQVSRARIGAAADRARPARRCPASLALMSDSDTDAVSAASTLPHVALAAFCPDEARIAADRRGSRVLPLKVTARV